MFEGKLAHPTAATVELQGSSVSISGNTAVIGAPYVDSSGSKAGAAYVFVRDPVSHVWTEEAELVPTWRVEYDVFGWSVAVSGDTAVVGAVGRDCGLGEDCGAAYVFERNGSSWSQSMQLTPAGVHASGWFGASVAIDGDYILVGQPYCGALVGCADVFKRLVNAAWLHEAELFASGGQSGELFGSSVAIGRSPDRSLVYAVVGAIVGAPPVPGAAYVFETNGLGPWPQVARLLPDPVASNIHFGTSVALSGDTVLVGADTSDEIGDAGSAYVYTRQVGGDWTREAKLLASDAGASDQFGISVALDGDTALIGALREDSMAADSGGAYVFRRSHGLWAEEGKLLVTDAGASAQFGASVALDGLSALVGAPRAGAADNGAGYVFALPAPEPGTSLSGAAAVAAITLSGRRRIRAGRRHRVARERSAG